MIRRLRRRHLRLVGLTGVITGPLLVAALASRPAPFFQESLPPPLVEPPAAPTGDGVELPTEPPLRLRPVGAGAIEVSAPEPIEGADLLLYWTPAGSSRSLSDADLLGPLRGGERQLLQLPSSAAGTAGVIVLYSLGHGDEVAHAPWPAEPEVAP